MKYCPQCSSSFPSSVVFCPKDDSFLIDKNELDPGMIIRNKYEIVRLIGSGGMASVYEARHIAFNEQVAIKVVKPGLGKDEEFLSRFRTEARVARKLAHPNAVTVTDLDETEDGMPFIVMELVLGADMRAVMQDSGPFTVARTLRVSKQVASALSAAHKLGIVHRDIKPDNIVLTGSGDNEVAKVLDFGIARTQGDTHNPHATKTGMMVGTPEYASPEQATGLKSSQLDGRCDIYSLGVTMYEMLTGVSPFKADSGVEMLIKHVHEVPQRPDILKPERGIPTAVAAIVMKCLEKQREDRFQTADDLINEITRCERLSSYSVPTPQQARAAAATAPARIPTPAPAPPKSATPPPKAQTPPRQAVKPATQPPKSPSSRTKQPVLLRQVEEERSKVPMIFGIIVVLAVIGGAWWANTRHQQQLEISSQAQDIVHSYPGVQSNVKFDLSVELTGAVKSYNDSQQLESKVRSLTGVADVVNQLRIETPTAPSDGSASTENPPSGTSQAPPNDASNQTRPDNSSRPTEDNRKSAKSAKQNPPTAAQNRRETANANAQQVANLIEQGVRERENGEYETAIRTFNRALQLDSGNSTARTELKRAQDAKQAEDEILQRRR